MSVSAAHKLDLDLEDLDDNLDASQLEELVDVPDSDHSQYQAPAAPQAGPSGQYQAQDATPAPAQPQYGQQQPPVSSLPGQAGPQGVQDQDGEGLDRIKPSDMPDEGSVVFLPLIHSSYPCLLPYRRRHSRSHISRDARQQLARGQSPSLPSVAVASSAVFDLSRGLGMSDTDPMYPCAVQPSRIDQSHMWPFLLHPCCLTKFHTQKNVHRRSELGDE